MSDILILWGEPIVKTKPTLQWGWWASTFHPCLETQSCFKWTHFITVKWSSFSFPLIFNFFILLNLLTPRTLLSLVDFFYNFHSSQFFNNFTVMSFIHSVYLMNSSEECPSIKDTETGLVYCQKHGVKQTFNKMMLGTVWSWIVPVSICLFTGWQWIWVCDLNVQKVFWSKA